MRSMLLCAAAAAVAIDMSPSIHESGMYKQYVEKRRAPTPTPASLYGALAPLLFPPLSLAPHRIAWGIRRKKCESRCHRRRRASPSTPQHKKHARDPAHALSFRNSYLLLRIATFGERRHAHQIQPWQSLPRIARQERRVGEVERVPFYVRERPGPS